MGISSNGEPFAQQKKKKKKFKYRNLIICQDTKMQKAEQATHQKSDSGQVSFFI